MSGGGIFDSPEVAAQARGLGLFAPPGGAAPSRAPTPPAAPTPTPPPEAAPAPPPEAPPTPTPERPARPRRPPRSRENFEHDELFDQFLAEKYQGGRALVEHPDPRLRQQRRNRDEPRIRFNTGMNYEPFRQQVGREFEAWKQQQQEQQQPAPRPTDLNVGDAVQHIDQIREGDVLESVNGTIMRVVSKDEFGNNLRYQWKKEDGDWSSRARQMEAYVFRNGSYTLREREVGDGAPPEEASQEPRVEVGGMVDDPAQLRTGDVIRNDWLRDHNQARKVLEVRENGSLLTQRFDTQNGENQGDPAVIPRAQILRQGTRYDDYSQYERVRAGTEPEPEAAPEPEPEPEGAPEPDRLKVGDNVERTDQLRVGDIFQNEYLRESQGGKRRVVVSVASDGTVKSRLVEPNGDFVTGDSPEVLAQSFLDSHGPYKVLAAVGARVERPSDVGRGTYIQAGDKKLRVVSSMPGKILAQEVSPETGRVFGRPVEIRAADLERTEHEVAPAPRHIQSVSGQGVKLTKPQDFRDGEVVRILHDKEPAWAKVTAVTGRSVTLKPMNPSTGRPARAAAQKLSVDDLAQWTDVQRSDEIPPRLRPPPPPLVEPGGGFSSPGSGDLVPNTQPRRYDHVRFPGFEGATRRNVKELLGRLAEGKDVAHVVADLVGVGGLAKSANTVTVTASGNMITVKVSGSHIINMTRNIHFNGPGRPSSITNAYFKLAANAPNGMGLKSFATQVAQARDAGFSVINVDAAGNHTNVDSQGRFRDGDFVGYWVWPRFGYDAPFPEDHFNNMPRSLQKAIRRLRPTAPDGLTFLDVFSSGEEGRNWWKFNGDGLNLSFDLNSDSRSMKFLTDYVREKGEARGQGADEFLNRAARLLAAATRKTIFDEPDDHDEEARVEVPQPLTDDDIEITDRIFDRMGEQMRAENEKGESPDGGNMNEHDKKTAAAVADLAGQDPGFRTSLMLEILKGAGVRDFAIDQFSQVRLLSNLRAGDRVGIAYRPGDRPEPAVRVERLVQTDFDEVLMGVTLQTPNGAEGVLVDKGEPQGILYWDGPNTPGYAVTQLSLGRSSLGRPKIGHDGGEKVGDEILGQMGGLSRIGAMLGARNVESGPRGLSFEWAGPRAALGNKVAVETAADGAYKVTFLLKTAKGERPLREYDAVRPEQLVDVFERQTGLFLRL